MGQGVTTRFSIAPALIPPWIGSGIVDYPRVAVMKPMTRQKSEQGPSGVLAFRRGFNWTGHYNWVPTACRKGAGPVFAK